MINLLLDCSSVDGGGGLTQAKGILGALSELEDELVVTVLIRRSKVHLLEDYNVDRITCSDRAIPRFLFQALFGLRYRGFDYVYTVFGIGLGCLPKRSIRGINVALPIICYDDSLFWTDLSFLSRIRARAKVLARRSLIKLRSDLIFCESETMRVRLINQAGFPTTKLIVVPPVESFIVRELRMVTSQLKNRDELNILYVTGNSFHKNLRYLLSHCDKLEEELLKMGVRFRVTVRGTSSSKVVNFIGPKSGKKLIDEYLAADVLMNVSDLESISNNFMEAQAINKPMLINDVDFAHFSVRVKYAVCNIRSTESFLLAVENLCSRKLEFPLSESKLAIDSKERLRKILSYYENY